MADPAVQIPVNLDTKGAEKNAKAFATSTAQALAGVAGALNIVHVAFKTVSAVVGGIVGTVATWTREASAAEASERRLATALQIRGQYTADAMRELVAYNTAIQRSTGISADELAAVQGTLVALGAKREELEKTTRAVVGLSAVTGSDLSTSATTVARALNGNTTALAKMGIAARDGADAIRQLGKMYAFAEAEGLTLEGQTRILSESWGDLQETLGAAVTRSTGARDSVGSLTKAVVGLTTYLDSDNGRLAVDRFFRSIALGAGFVADTIVQVDSLYERTKNWLGGGVSNVQSFDPSATSAPGPIDVLRGLSEDLGAIGVGDASSGLPSSPAVRGKPTQRRDKEAERAAKEQAKMRREAAKFALDAERESAEAMTAWRESQAEYQLSLQVKREEDEASHMRMRLEGVGASLSAERTMWQEHNGAVDGMLQDAAQMASDGLGSTIAGMAAAIATGKGGLDTILAQMVGGVLTSIGTMLIQLGTAGVLAGTLGTFIPFFAELTGGPLGVGAGLAAIAGGMAMVGIGAALGGAAQPGATASAPRSAAAPSSPRVPQTAAPAGFVRGSEAQTNVTNINVSFAGSIATGSPRQIARSLRDLLREGGMMIPAGT